jgi:hypothetical protein
MSDTTYKIVWGNEHNSGELPLTYDTLDEAISAAREWEAEMIAVDDNPEEAALEYHWEVIRTNPPMPLVGAHNEGDSHDH